MTLNVLPASLTTSRRSAVCNKKLHVSTNNNLLYLIYMIEFVIYSVVKRSLSIQRGSRKYTNLHSTWKIKENIYITIGFYVLSLPSSCPFVLFYISVISLHSQWLYLRDI